MIGYFKIQEKLPGSLRDHRPDIWKQYHRGDHGSLKAGLPNFVNEDTNATLQLQIHKSGHRLKQNIPSAGLELSNPYYQFTFA